MALSSRFFHLPVLLRAVPIALSSLPLLTHAQTTPFSKPALPPEFDLAVDNGSLGTYPTRTFLTQEDIVAPLTNYVKWSPACDDGLLNFLTPRGWMLSTPGPMILDNRGEMIWGHHFENTFGGQAYDFMVQKYQGQDYLTFWLGDDRVRGHGSGAYYMLNSSYDVVHKVTAANGYTADLHEFLITADDTALLTVYDVAPGDVSKFRTFDPEEIPLEEQNYVWDCAFQEIDIRTGELLFEWKASDHVHMDETFRDIMDSGHMTEPWDWYHINSIDKDSLGNYLISARYPHSIAYIDGRTQETLWQLGGKENDFMDLSGGQALDFAWQHDARFFSPDTFPDVYQPPPPKEGFTTKLLTLFDNAAEDQHYLYGVRASRGLLLEITYPTPGTTKARSNSRYKPKGPIKVVPSAEAVEGGEVPDQNMVKVQHINGTDPNWTVRLIKSYDNPAPYRASSQGSMQVVPQEYGSPKILVGYGLNAAWAEFDANGTLLCDVHFGAQTSWDKGDVQSYRIYKKPWIGRPEWAPSVEITDDDEEVYVSWNGATEVVMWILQCADTPALHDSAWADAVSVPKSGFETTIPVPPEINEARYLRVLALASNGRRLDYGTSAIIDRNGESASYLSAPIQASVDVAATLPGSRTFLLVVLNVSFLFILYEVYRRYLSWKLGRPGAGPVRWRKG